MPSGIFRARKPTGDNLTVHTNGDPAPDEDFITFFVKAGFQANSSLVVTFISPTSFKDGATYRANAQNKQQPSSTLGLASILEVQNAQIDLLGRDRFASVTDADKLSAATAEKTWVIPSSEWQYLSIPKRLFIQHNNFSWANVNELNLHFLNVRQEETCFSDVFLYGGGEDHGGMAAMAQGTSATASSGMQGTYKYKLTFKNSETGNRSNPTTATQVAKNVMRAAVTLSNIPASSDSQVDKVEIWRTVGGGSDFFKIAEIDEGVATFVDEVADHDSLDSRAGVAVMTDEALPFDNDVPSATFDQHVIRGLRAFWISNASGSRSRLFFSPTGRPESQDGFVEISKEGDPLHRMIIFNGVLYIFSESKVYRIDEDASGILRSHAIDGVPGVKFAQRRTVAATPRGILWQANDGVRAFNGSQSILVNPDPVLKIFRGEAAENLAAFEGIVATYARGEYIISDGTQTLGVQIEGGAWREIGFNDVTALFYEWDTDKIVGGRTSNTQLLEEEGVFTDDDADISFEWETAALDGPNDEVMIVERVFIDIDPNGETVSANLINRFDTVALTDQSGSGRRTFEDEVQLMVLKPSIRFTGTVGARVTLYDVELEVRNLVLGVNIVGGGRIEVKGRYREDVGSGILVFEVKPDQSNTAPLDLTGSLFVIDRLMVEADTQSTDVTPQIITSSGTIHLDAISTSTREFNETTIGQIGMIEELRLVGNFLASGTRPQIYRAELYLRELNLGLNLVENVG